MEITATNATFNNYKRIDRIGVVASVLCAIHCAVTPILLILLPTFGKSWSNPATHWGMAILVTPIAVFMMLKSYKKHGKKKVLYIGGLGIICIIVGAVLPYIEASPAAVINEPQVNEPQAVGCGSCSSGAAVDSCCPSLVTNSTGEKSLHIPPASIVTTLGGVFLIILHTMNLCGCGVCHTKKQPKIAPAS